MGDILESVDSVLLDSLSPVALTKTLRGQPYTPVTLLLFRPSSNCTHGAGAKSHVVSDTGRTYPVNLQESAEARNQQTRHKSALTAALAEMGVNPDVDPVLAAQIAESLRTSQQTSFTESLAAAEDGRAKGRGAGGGEDAVILPSAPLYRQNIHLPPGAEGRAGVGAGGGNGGGNGDAAQEGMPLNKFSVQFELHQAYLHHDLSTQVRVCVFVFLSRTFLC